MSQELSTHPDESDQLEEALALLSAGLSVEDVLSDAGEDAEWLRPLLEMAADVGDLQQAVPIPPPEASLERMLAHAEAVRAEPVTSTPAAPSGDTLLLGFSLSTILVIAGAVVALVIGAGLAWTGLPADDDSPLFPPALTETAMPTTPPTATPVPTLTPTPGVTASPTVRATSTPLPSPTPVPTDEPLPSSEFDEVDDESGIPATPPIEDEVFEEDTGELDDAFDDGDDDFSDEEDGFEDNVDDFADDEDPPDDDSDDGDGDDNESNDNDSDDGDDDNGHGNDPDGCDEDNPGSGGDCDDGNDNSDDDHNDNDNEADDSDDDNDNGDDNTNDNNDD